MDGILLIDKPEGLTSHDVVARVRRTLRTKRVGHTGTLDPFATGLLVILVGKATRLAQFLDKDEKEYRALVRFGFETDTGDRTGEPLRAQDAADGKEVLSSTDWDLILRDFRGKLMQTPPMFSAKKIDGMKLYQFARKGETVERKAVEVEIFELELVGEPDIEKGEMTLRIVCSAGTYIRTLAADIARAAGGRAHLAELRRTRAGRFSISGSTDLATLEASAAPVNELLPMRAAVEHLPSLVLSDDRVKKTRSGLSTRIFDDAFSHGDAARMETAEGELVAVGVFDGSENAVRPKVVLI